MTIDKFDGKYRFLSNFYPCFVTTKDGAMKFGSSEAAFQAMKCMTREERIPFTKMTASESKRAGKKVQMRPDWNIVRVSIMHNIVLAKFEQNPSLKALLLETGDAELIEGNWWNDTFWGVCNGVGENNLGKILMAVRSHLRGDK